MKKLIDALIVSLCIISLIGVVSAKWETEGWDFNVQTVNFPKNVTKGDTLPVLVSVYNSGGKTGTVCMIIGIQKPDSSIIYPLNTTVVNIPSKQSKTTTLNWRVTESPGKYLIGVGIYDPKACTEGPANSHLFDTTGFVYPLEIKKEWWQDQLAIIAIASIIAVTIIWHVLKKSKFKYLLLLFGGAIGFVTGGAIGHYLVNAFDFALGQAIWGATGFTFGSAIFGAVGGVAGVDMKGEIWNIWKVFAGAIGFTLSFTIFTGICGLIWAVIWAVIGAVEAVINAVIGGAKN